MVHSSVGCTLPFRHFCTNSRTFFHALRVKKRIRCPKDKCRTGADASSCLAFANIAESNPTMRIYNTAHHESITELSCQTNNAYAFQTLGTWLVVRFLDCLGGTSACWVLAPSSIVTPLFNVRARFLRSACVPGCVTTPDNATSRFAVYVSALFFPFLTIFCPFSANFFP